MTIGDGGGGGNWPLAAAGAADLLNVVTRSSSTSIAAYPVRRVMAVPAAPPAPPLLTLELRRRHGITWVHSAAPTWHHLGG